MRRGWGIPLALLMAAASRPGDLEERAGRIRPSAEETRFKDQIPWFLSPEEAAQAARREKRPVFIWTVDGDPWDRL